MIDRPGKCGSLRCAMLCSTAFLDQTPRITCDFFSSSGTVLDGALDVEDSASDSIKRREPGLVLQQPD